MSKKDPLAKALAAAGWRLVRQNKHLIFACPCGHTLLTCPATPSDHRSAKNTLALLRRLTAACS